MQLSWSTFVLEILNFLMLVWILKRFLYKPVLAAIASRKAAIEKTLADAKATHDEAAKLEQQYQKRLAQWEQERVGLREALDQDLRVERDRLMADLRKSLEQEREKERVLTARRLAQAESNARGQGVSQAVQFTARLLQRIADPEIEARLITVVLEDLPQMPSQEREALENACRESQRAVTITSAFPMPDPRRSQVVEALKQATHEEVSAAFRQDASLLAGLEISVGARTLRANLRDELRFFAEMLNHDGQPQ